MTIKHLSVGIGLTIISLYTPRGLADEGLIVVEPTAAVQIDYETRKTTLRPYAQRRQRWGGVVGVSVGQALPENYEPFFVASTFDTVYGSSEDLLIELHTNFKRNFSVFSLGLEFSAGYYSKPSDKAIINSKLQVTYGKAGVQLALDNLWSKEPYVVPYVSGGVYGTYFRETQLKLAHNGTTEAAFYVTGGLMFDIDWLDPLSATSAYFESGIENTFLFVEASYFLASAHPQDPDFEGYNYNAGIKMEY